MPSWVVSLAISDLIMKNLILVFSLYGCGKGWWRFLDVSLWDCWDWLLTRQLSAWWHWQRALWCFLKDGDNWSWTWWDNPVPVWHVDPLLALQLCCGLWLFAQLYWVPSFAAPFLDCLVQSLCTRWEITPHPSMSTNLVTHMLLVTVLISTVEYDWRIVCCQFFQRRCKTGVYYWKLRGNCNWVRVKSFALQFWQHIGDYICWPWEFSAWDLSWTTHHAVFFAVCF